MIERSDKLNNQAIRLASDGAYTEAIACFKRAILIEQKNYLLWFNLGLTYRDCGKIEDSIQALKEAYHLNPENSEVLETLATLYLQNHQREKCKYYSSLGTHQFGGNPKFFNLLGVCNFQEEEYKEACTCFEIAVMQNPFYLDALYNLRDTYEETGNLRGMKICQERIDEVEG